ncbi:hypothetical protein B0H63DRAFT_225330 [Podospora didyma]|uniref:Ser/arg-related nuclear matrix protein n=1 Tax=Podospora didyma TaxID=330526 RepID=A0AAE0KK97_9PEZI|nr:hypothetical protein B0H63DRAFT_225330 [Podospora didyma]
MVETDDIQRLLQTGSWKTSRSRSPSFHNSPERAYQPSKPNVKVKRPPRPIVEDEVVSLAKEYGASVVSEESSEDPKHPGDVDQYPILLPVHEYNPERRFVILSDGEKSAGTTQPPTTEYEANTCRKYVIVSPEENAKDGEKRPTLSKPKSHSDLPRLRTDFEQPEAPIRRSNSRRNPRDKALVDQEPRDHTSRRENARPPEDAFLSPVYKQTTGGRDRPYREFDTAPPRSPARSPSTRGEAQIATSEDRRPRQPPPSQPTKPGPHRRVSSATGAPKRHARTPERPNHSVDAFPPPFVDSSEPAVRSLNDGRGEKSRSERPRSSIDPFPAGYSFNDPEDIMNFMMPGNVAPRGERRNISPPLGHQKSNSPPYPVSAASSKMPSRSASYRGRRPSSSSRERDGYSSDDGQRKQRSDRPDRARTRQRNTLEPDSSSYLMPDPGQPSNPGRSKANPSSPLPSPRLSQSGPFLDVSAQSIPKSPKTSKSSTFPTEKNRRYDDRSVSPAAHDSRSPPRPANTNSGRNGTASLPVPIPLPVDRGSSVELRAATPPYPTHGSLDTNSTSLQWQPSPFHPDEYKASLDRPIESFRRYSEDVRQGLVAKLPDCHWTTPSKVGNAVFSTLPRAPNFLICPGCYSGIFAESRFSRSFVPAPMRSTEQLVFCDFGSSFWYRIAYLMTIKYQYSDLLLLEHIASVAKRHQPCAGPQYATRTWYSMQGPNMRQPIASFSVCPSCVKMVETLFPNLSGVFVPLNAQADWDVCELHFTPDRKRFIQYFDLLENTSDEAHNRKSVPDVTRLADSIRDITLVDECRRNAPLRDCKWYVMESIPDFTVCEECFDAVIWPLLESRNCGDIPRNFYKGKQLKTVAACQLYSDRMRGIFKDACYRNDIGYLKAAVKDKFRLDIQIRNNLTELARDDPNDPWVRGEMARLVKQLKENE